MKTFCSGNLDAAFSIFYMTNVTCLHKMTKNNVLVSLIVLSKCHFVTLNYHL